MITLKTLPQATAQEVFDQVKNHLLTQMEKSIDSIGQCLYINEKGLKCAAGCLISKEEWMKEFNRNSWYSMVLEGFAPDAHQELIQDLQEVHDETDVDKWEKELKRVALNYNLKF